MNNLQVFDKIQIDIFGNPHIYFSHGISIVICDIHIAFKSKIQLVTRLKSQIDAIIPVDIDRIYDVKFINDRGNL